MKCRMTVRREIALVVLLVLLAGSLRVIGLGDVPPGLFKDEAYNGLDAWRVVVSDSWYPIFFEANGGREPLFIYLVSVALWALGPEVGALRLVSAILGTLVTPALYVLGRALAGRRAGFLAAVAWAVTFAAIAVSRVAFRAVTLPLLATLTLWLLLQAFSLLGRTRPSAGEGEKRHHPSAPTRSGTGEYRSLVVFALAGLTLGLTLYTYIPGRVFPLVAAFFALHWGLTHRDSWRWLVAGLAVAALVAALVFAPLGLYFLATPAAFTSRAADISVLALPDPLRGLVENIGERLSMFFWLGDTDPVRNLPGRPVLDPWLALCALAGLVVCLRRVSDPTRALLVVWAVVLFVPALPVKGLPDVLHVVGMLPALFLLASLGATTAWEWMERRLPAVRKWVPAAIVVTLFAASGAVSTWHYFVDWASDPAVAAAYHAPSVDLANDANERVARGEIVLLPQSVYGHASVAYLTLRTCPYVGGLPDGFVEAASATFLVPPDYDGEELFAMLTRERGYYLSPLDPQTIASLRQAAGTPVLGRRGTPVARSVEECAYAVVEPHSVAPIAFGDQIVLYGTDLGGSTTQRPRVTPGGTITVTVYWQAIRPPDGDYRVFVHLLDREGRTRGGWDGTPASKVFPTGTWRPGEIVPAVYHVPVDTSLSTDSGPGLPPGKYNLEIGLYHLLTGKRLDAVAADGTNLDSRVLLGPLKVPFAGATPAASPTFPAQANLGRIELLGCDVEPATLTVRPDDALRVSLHWRCLALMDADYTVFVHLVDESGQPVAQHDGQPRGGRYPTFIWDVGETILDNHRFAVPADAAPGTYRLVTGLYDPVTWTRLPVLDDAGNPIGDHVPLTTVEIAR